MFKSQGHRDITRLDDVLLRMGIITQEQAAQARTRQLAHPEEKMGQILVAQGHITQEKLNEALRHQTKLRNPRKAVGGLMDIMEERTDSILARFVKPA